MKPIAILSAGLIGLAMTLPASAQQGPTQPPPAVSAIVGPGYHVADVQKSLKFYRDILGMQVRMQYGPADKPDVVIGFGADTTATGIMLLSDRSVPSPRKIEHSHGYSRLAVRLADLSGVHRRLRASGYVVSDIRVVHDVFLMAMATDPDGYQVELLGPRPKE
jgi:catechol 2,3-dioxygenase-like lactoylglutathione lyase family enzyme